MISILFAIEGLLWREGSFNPQDTPVLSFSLLPPPRGLPLRQKIPRLAPRQRGQSA
jgi:hypothetical protein